MKTVTAFTCSTGNIAVDKDLIPMEYSYIHYLSQDKSIDRLDGFWTNGLTILHIRNMIRQKLKEVTKTDLNWLILHVGVCEAFSHTAPHILNYIIQYLFQWSEDAWFKTYVLPKAVKASR